MSQHVTKTKRLLLLTQLLEQRHRLSASCLLAVAFALHLDMHSCLPLSLQVHAKAFRPGELQRMLTMGVSLQGSHSRSQPFLCLERTSTA